MDEQREEDSMQIGGDDDSDSTISLATSRHATKTFAVQLLRRMLKLCASERAHFDLSLAKELVLSGGKCNIIRICISVNLIVEPNLSYFSHSL